MKLLNQSVKHLSLYILLIVSVWSVVFYISMLDEIEDSIDDGLANYKLLIIQKAHGDSSVLAKQEFDESNYAVHEVEQPRAITIKDRYVDTLMYMVDEDDMEPVRMLTTAFEQNGHFYQLKVLNSMVEEDDLIEDLFWSAVWLYIILVASIIIINNLVLQKLWAPFYSLLAQLQHFRLGRSKELPKIATQTREFNDLNTAINDLLEHSVEAYNQQKQFIENAAHELQTPLAVATSRLELLLEKDSLASGDAAVVSDVLHVMERMSQLNKSLLLLTKIENKQFFDNRSISFNVLARQCMADLEDFAAFKQVTMHLHEAGECRVDMDESLATVVLLNLVKNAVIHNEPGGKVEISVGNDTVQVLNTGAPHALDADSIFHRFYKSDHNTKGVGLGLAIVKAICQLYGYTVIYRFVNNGHCFEIRTSISGK